MISAKSIPLQTKNKWPVPLPATATLPSWIIHPDAESPVAGSDDVGVVVVEVVDDVDLAGVQQILDRQPAAVFAGEQIADR